MALLTLARRNPRHILKQCWSLYPVHYSLRKFWIFAGSSGGGHNIWTGLFDWSSREGMTLRSSRKTKPKTPACWLMWFESSCIKFHPTITAITQITATTNFHPSLSSWQGEIERRLLHCWADSYKTSHRTNLRRNTCSEICFWGVLPPLLSKCTQIWPGTHPAISQHMCHHELFWVYSADNFTCSYLSYYLCGISFFGMDTTHTNALLGGTGHTSLVTWDLVCPECFVSCRLLPKWANISS